MEKPVKYVAQLKHVREVSLLGTADLAYWNDHLAADGHRAAERDGYAQIKIISADGRFAGIRFRELSVSVLITPPNNRPGREAAFLVQAFNSSRMFAFCERTFFATPYAHGDVRVSVSSPVSIHLNMRGEILFSAQMQSLPSTPERTTTLSADQQWEGPVFLPNGYRRIGRDSRFFFARIAGYTRTFPFDPSTDVLTFAPSERCHAFRALADSRFVAKEWTVREDAVHCKSKTYRSAAMSFGPPAMQMI
ncbi:MAG: hypothetical protein JWN51_2046 [Phycisphaerales bacterium]|nr:hypothetical protein [Phycisphaerales bacterium]